jgi:hypothetical protein
VGFPGTGDFRGAMPSDEDERCIMLHGIIPLLVTLLSPDSLEKGATGAYRAIMYMIVIIVDLMRCNGNGAYARRYGCLRNVYGVVLIRFSLPEKHVVWKQRHRLRERACRVSSKGNKKSTTLHSQLIT